MDTGLVKLSINKLIDNFNLIILLMRRNSLLIVQFIDDFNLGYPLIKHRLWC
jgi:hypothetical protein